jgi:CotH kinase protein
MSVVLRGSWCTRWSPRSRRGIAPARLAAMIAAAAFTAGCGADPAAPAPVVAPPATIVAEALPALAVTTTNLVPITSREVYVSATYRIADTTGKVTNEGTLDIRGRGNTTWGMPKKPYRMRLTNGTALMGMPSSRHWVLLANYSDKTLVRNDVTFEFSRLVGMEWTPRSQFVELTLNGAYQGIYQLVEHVRIATDRVNIPELRVSDTTAATISGGYLMEVDERRGEDFCFNSSRTTMIFCLSNPETLNDPAWAKQRAYITDYIRQVDDAIFGPQFADPQLGYAAYIDVDSAIRYYLVNEFFKNVDGNLRLSTYLYKKRDGKLFFGPVWDFDLALGNVNYLGADHPEGWHTRTAQWFTRLFQDPAFAARVKARWNELRTNGSLDRVDQLIAARQKFLGKVQVRNFQRWPILNIWVWPNRVVTGSWDGEYNAMAFWLFSRRRWMEGAFGS